MNNTLHTLGFAAALGATCSALLVGVSLFTAPYRQANARSDEIRNFLAALEAPVAPRARADELLDFFERRVRRVERDDLTRFEYIPEGDDRPTAVAIAFAGPGVWGPIEGVLALEPDMTTIRGVRFFRQEETPGLGGEIASESFQGQFRGKRIVSRAGVPGFRVRPSGPHDEPNRVDAITGATMTSERVEAMLDRVAKRVGATGN